MSGWICGQSTVELDVRIREYDDLEQTELS